MQRAGQGVLRVIWVLVACSVATSRQAVVSQAIRKERGEVCSTVQNVNVHRWADYNTIVNTNP